MDRLTKLEILADAAKYDASCASSGAPKRASRGGSGLGAGTGAGICHSFTPDGRCVSLAIGTIESLAPFLDLPLLLQRFHKAHPKVKVVVQEAHLSALEDSLRHGHLDLAFMPAPSRAASGLSYDGLFTSSIVAAHSKDHIELRKTVEVASHDVARRLVEAGLGWTVHFAAPVRESIEAGVLAAVPIKGLALRRSLACAIERPLSRAAQVSIEVLREVVYMLVREQRWPHSELVSNFPSHKIKKKLQGKRRY